MDWKDGFAKEQLEKYGWTEGSGLGKTEHGMKEAIKVKIKNDTAGVGHDAAEEFKFHWWDHVFNKAANSIKVKDSEEGVLVEKESDSGKISNRRAGLKTFDNKAMLYGRFIKSATLMNSGETVEEEKADSSSSESEDDSMVMRCTDEAMFKKCGGRTAHKGARHGLGLSGKLARIQEQEKLFSKVEEVSSSSSQNEEPNHNSRKKHKKSKCRKNEMDEFSSKKRSSETVENGNLSEDSEVKHEKAKKKKKRTKENSSDENSEVIENVTEDVDSVVKRKKAKKKKRHREEECVTNEVNDISENSLMADNEMSKKSKKKKVPTATLR